MYSAFAVQARQGDPGPGRWSGSFHRPLARGKLFGSDHRPPATDRSPDPVLFLTSRIGQASETKTRPSRIGDERVIARGATPFRLEKQRPIGDATGRASLTLSLGTSFGLRLRIGSRGSAREMPAPDNGGVSGSGYFSSTSPGALPQAPLRVSPCGSEVHSPPALVRVLTLAPARWPPLRWVLVLVEACNYSIADEITPLSGSKSRGRSPRAEPCALRLRPQPRVLACEGAGRPPLREVAIFYGKVLPALSGVTSRGSARDVAQSKRALCGALRPSTLRRAQDRLRPQRRTDPRGGTPRPPLREGVGGCVRAAVH